jgi:non-lysosomal glucosylceramidase
VIGYYFTIGAESPYGDTQAQRGDTPRFGSPQRAPLGKTNYTSYQDCNQWKDLGSDFVFRSTGPYQFTG